MSRAAGAALGPRRPRAAGVTTRMTRMARVMRVIRTTRAIGMQHMERATRITRTANTALPSSGHPTIEVKAIVSCGMPLAINVQVFAGGASQ
jgi:hypothetical protein